MTKSIYMGLLWPEDLQDTSMDKIHLNGLPIQKNLNGQKSLNGTKDPGQQALNGSSTNGRPLTGQQTLSLNAQQTINESSMNRGPSTGLPLTKDPDPYEVFIYHRPWSGRLWIEYC